MNYIVKFYESKDGRCELWDFLECLRMKGSRDKDARIQYNQITLYIQLLQNNGTCLPSNIAKHINDDIWELRPGNNRILYFFYGDKTFVLLHHFHKQTQKIPKRELDRAKREKIDYLSREGARKS